MPPVLDIAFDELPGGAAQQVLAHQRRFRVHERHHVLQLVAEPEGATRLVRSAARPQAAGHRLVHEPAVGQHVDRRVRRDHLHGTQRPLPLRQHRVQRRVRGRHPAIARDEAAGVGGIAPDAEPEDDLAFLSIGEFEVRPAAPRRGRDPHPPCRKGAPASSPPDCRASIAPQEFGAVAARAARRVVHIEEGDAVGELRVVGVARQEGAASPVDFRDHVHRSSSAADRPAPTRQ